MSLKYTPLYLVPVCFDSEKIDLRLIRQNFPGPWSTVEQIPLLQKITNLLFKNYWRVKDAEIAIISNGPTITVVGRTPKQ